MQLTASLDDTGSVRCAVCGDMPSLYHQMVTVTVPGEATHLHGQCSVGSYLCRKSNRAFQECY